MAQFFDDFRGGGTGVGEYVIKTNSASQVPLTVQGASGQTANIFAVKNSAGTVVFAVQPDGDITITGDVELVVDQQVTGNVTAGGNLSVTGASSLTGAVTLGSSLSVTGATTFTGDVTANHNLTVNNTLNFNGFSYGNVLFFNEQVNAPSHIAEKGAVYSLEVGGVTELHYKDSAGNITQITSAGIPAVWGPASSTDNAIARWDGTGGSNIQNSGVIIDDSDNVSGLTTLVIDGTNLEALLVRQDADAGDVFKVDTLSPAAAHVADPVVVNIAANGGNAFAGSGNQVTFLGISGSLSSGTQTGRVRGADALLTFSGTVVLSGTEGNAARAFNASVAWNSTGTAAELVGINNTTLAGGGAGVTSGLITDAHAEKLRVGFNTSDAGSFTRANGLYIQSPLSTDATHTIGTVTGIRIDNQEATGITTAYSILTGTGRVSFGGALDVTTAALGATITNTNDGASSQVMILEGNRATMADGDEAYLSLRLSDDGGTQTEFARITWVATDVNVASSVDGRIDFAVVTAGALADELSLTGAGLYPSASGGLSLGISGTPFGNVYLASGAIVNFAAADVTWTHSAGQVAFSGDFVGNNANSGRFAGDAVASGTVPTYNPNRTDADSGLGAAGADQLSLIAGGVEIIRLTEALTGATAITVTQQAGTSGAPTALLITGGAHTAITAATEDIGINFDFSATKTWAAGAGPLASQREVIFQAPTYNGNAAGALTITNAATVYISGAPIQGTNMTLSNTHALWVDAGNVRFDGTLNATGGGALTGTWSDMGTVTTIDINGGTIDGVTIGGASAGAGTFTALVATSLDLNGALDLDVAALGATITNTADAASSQVMILEGDRATMVDNDEAYLTMRLSNDAGTQTEFARLTWVATDVNAATSVDGRLDFAVVTAGVLADELQLDGASLAPSADGGLDLGTTTLAYGNLFLNTGAVINWEGGDVTITHAANILTFAGGDVTFTNNLFTLNKSSAGIALDVNNTSTAYTTAVATVDVSRTGALTGVDTEIILDVLIGPAFTLTEPASGAVDYIAFTVDLGSVAVTAGAGDANTYAARLVACSDADAKENLALWVDTGNVKLSGGGTSRQISAAGGLLNMEASTINGNNASGTIAVGSAVSLGVTTFTNGTASLTMTDVASLYIAGIPVASTNVIFTNTALALWVDAGNVRFDGDILLPTSGSVINFNAGDVTLTHSSNALTIAGGNFVTAADIDINMSAGGRLYGGGIQANKQDLAANTNLTLDENDSVVNVTSGAVSVNTITLPAASGNEGMIISVYLVTDGGQNANVVRAGADVIQNGSADLSNTQVALDDAGDFVMLQCVNSTMWQILVNSGGTVT